MAVGAREAVARVAALLAVSRGDAAPALELAEGLLAARVAGKPEEAQELSPVAERAAAKAGRWSPEAAVAVPA